MAKFLSNINLETANDIQFKTTAGANAGKISQTGDDLVISNAVGDILLGNGSDDVYIGDGTNTVDIRFEQNMAIFADSSSTRTLTLGGANTNLVLETPTLNNATFGATTINNKLTFTTANGYILFDYEPSGDTGEYTSEVPLLKIDHNGTEKTILSRVSENSALQFGHDDTVAITAGDIGDTVKTNWGMTNENVVLAAEGGFYAWGWPNNHQSPYNSWSTRYEMRFKTDHYNSNAGDPAADALATNGLYIGSGSSTQFIDMNRNLKNIGTISSGAITSTGTLDVAGDTTITNGLHVHHDEGIEIGDTGNNSTATTTLTSFNSGGNSRMKIKGGNFYHDVAFETSWNDFEYAELVSSYNTSDTTFKLKKSASDGSTAATTTISTGTSTFAGNVTAGSNSLTAGSLDINGDADISGNITSATWNGGVISSTYLDSDTAHLSGSQTFTGQKTFQGNVILDDGSGDTPILKFINGSDNTYNQHVSNGGNLQITRTNNGGADVVLTGHATDHTLTTLQVGGSSTFGTDVTIAGNLTVNGTTVTVDTTNLNVQDKNITLNYSTSDSSSSANGAGITIQDAVNSSTDATILWDATNDEFDFSHAINVTGNIGVSGTVDGRDIATDGTKLDGIANFANYYIHPTNAGNKHIPAGGASGNFLKYSSAGTAAWSDVTSADVGLSNVVNVDQRNASNINSGTLSAARLADPITSSTSGSAASLSDISYGQIVIGGESGYSKLDGNASSTSKFLRSRGTGSSATEPSWEVIGYNDLGGTVPTWNQNTTGTAAGLSSTLAVSSGGTGLTSISTLLNSNTTKSDVGLSNVENTALSTYTGNGGALDNQYITNGAGYTTNTGTTTASNSQTFTNKSGNISQWTNDSGYTTNTGTTTPSNTQTFTNKTIDANGTGNTISNIDIGNMTAGVIVTESEGIGNNDNDTTIPTSAAVVDYVSNNAGTNTTYDLTCNQTGSPANDSNPKIVLTGSDSTQDSITITGAGATTVTRTSNSGFTISSTDTDTNTQLSNSQVKSAISSSAAADTIISSDELLFLDNSDSDAVKKGDVGDLAAALTDNTGGLTTSSGIIKVNTGAGITIDTNKLKINLNPTNTGLQLDQTNGLSVLVAASGGIAVDGSNQLTLNSDITSVDTIYNTALHVGRASNQMHFDFSASDAIKVFNNTSEEFRFTSSGVLHANNDVIGFSNTITSDRKLKKNIRPLDQYGLDEVLKLKPVMYDWKDEKRSNNNIGFIAQDVQEVIPELVNESVLLNSKEGETKLGVEYNKMIAVLTNAIQEQQKQIEELKKLINGNTK